jgi:transposase
LTNAQELELKDELQIARAQQDPDKYMRIQGLLLVHRGFQETDAADIIGVGRRTLQDWIHRYRCNGIAGLDKGPYLGGKSKLSDEQKSELAEIIAAGPEAAGYDTGVWIAPIIVELVKKRYGVSYSSSRIARTLHDLRFSLQYPTKKFPKADEEAQERWLTQKLPDIKKSEEGKRRSAVSRRVEFPAVGIVPSELGSDRRGVLRADPAGSQKRQGNGGRENRKGPEMAFAFRRVVQCRFVHSFPHTACSLLRRNQSPSDHRQCAVSQGPKSA